MNDLTGRTDFVESWLTEMPTGLGSFDNYDQLVYFIKDRIKSGSEVIDVGHGIKKIVGPQVVNYWVEIDGEIILGTELYVKPQSLVVSLTGKHKQFKGKKPFASDLYMAILKDYGKSVRIVSDESLSDEGYSIWKKLLASGCKISLYDKEQPGKTFNTFSNSEEMDQYFAHDDTNYKRYQYILSESGNMISETRSLFNTRRYRELIPGLL